MIKLTYDIKVYRETLKEIIKPSDDVVELGCHVGNSTNIIAELASQGKIIALDNSPEAVESMSQLEKKYNHVEFIRADVRLHETLEDVMKKMSGCDVLSIDLGGGYHPDTTFKVFFIWSSSLKPRVTIIRNRGLIDFIFSASAEEKIESRYGWLESSARDGVPKRLKELKLWSSKL
ncbi:class I SAM-dependent methyltransferase [Methanobacterium sp. ACI-7]|uniref:class I SAM-dependent methyltransferase n=1 Tax=unclassified Methanobacterium TaxID=2627676 RepID=UPI0039C0B341